MIVSGEHHDELKLDMADGKVEEIEVVTVSEDRHAELE